MRLIYVILSFLCYTHGQKIHVAVYYESLCPYSSAFITTQLHPWHEALEDHIEVLFVPFGKSISENNGANFTCQHGPAECFGNMIQSCGLYALTGQTIRKTNYIACQMTLNADRTGETCAEENGIEFTEITRCVNGGLGTLLQIEAERITHKIRKPYPERVPTIVFNHEFNQELTNIATVDFLSLICEMINNAAPACSFIPA